MKIEQHPGAAKIATETALKSAGKRRWIGKSLNRVEDPRFLRGEGRYIDDIKLENMAHAAIVRSPHAHALIVSIDTTKAQAYPGVIRVVTGADVAARAAPLPSFGAGPIAFHSSCSALMSSAVSFQSLEPASASTSAAHWPPRTRA